MYNFILKQIPLSYNSRKKDKYEIALKKSFRTYNSDTLVLKGDLYGIVYYYFKKDLGLDADNLSKPVWDCLGKVIYEDDKQIKYRVAASHHLANGDYSTIDFSGLQEPLALDLLDAFEKEDHIIYIECGRFNPSLLNFNIEK